jgi:hypothetical protein
MQISSLGHKLHYEIHAWIFKVTKITSKKIFLPKKISFKSILPSSRRELIDQSCVSAYSPWAG